MRCHHGRCSTSYIHRTWWAPSALCFRIANINRPISKEQIALKITYLNSPLSTSQATSLRPPLDLLLVASTRHDALVHAVLLGEWVAHTHCLLRTVVVAMGRLAREGHVVCGGCEVVWDV